MIFFIAFLAAITPGPDILLTLRATLKDGFIAGFCALCGISTGWIIYLLTLYFGFAHIFRGNLAQCILGIFGGAYLCYLSFMLFRAPPNNIDFNAANPPTQGFYLKGLIINLSNPKAIIFFSVIIAPYLDKNLALNIALLFFGLVGAFLLVMLVAVAFRKIITNRLFDAIDKICAVVFLGFGIALFALSWRKIEALL